MSRVRTLKEVLNTPVKSTGLVGEGVPRFSYEARIPGQLNFIMHRCNAEMIRVASNGKTVMLYSEKKIPDLLKIIEESVQFTNIPAPELQSESLVCTQDHRTLAVMVKRSEVTYVTESNFPELLYHIYKKEIPRFNHYRIFSTGKEMIEYLWDKENLLI